MASSRLETERAKQMDLVIGKLDRAVEKMQELHVLTTQILTKHEGQIELLDSRITDTQRDLDDHDTQRDDDRDRFQNKIDEIQKQFVISLDKATERMVIERKEFMTQYASTHAVVLRELETISVRVGSLETWRYYLLGICGTIGAIFAFASPLLQKWIESIF